MFYSTRTLYTQPLSVPSTLYTEMWYDMFISFFLTLYFCFFTDNYMFKMCMDCVNNFPKNAELTLEKLNELQIYCVNHSEKYIDLIIKIINL